MDAARFDALVRAAHRSGSRRGLLGGLAALALAPLNTVAKPAPAACLAIGKRCSLGKGKHSPPPCAKCCSRFGAAGPGSKARCTCKGEGVPCDNDSQCCGGQCRMGSCTGCPGATVFCSDGCADLQTNPQHCGSCDTACAPGQRCVSGSCVCDGQSCATGCCDGTSCKRGTSPSACGDNGANCVVCDIAGEQCQDGACVCPSGVICSVSGCCPQATDVCDPNDQCCASACSGKTCGQDNGCGGQCTACPAGQRCASGTCVAGQGTCPTGTNVCATPQPVFCNGDEGRCICYVSSEGDTRCGDNMILPESECGECRSSQDCVAKFPAIAGVFCVQTSGTGCCRGDAAGFCNAPCQAG